MSSKMNSSAKETNRKLKHDFKQYVIPSTIAFLVTSIYAAIDGFFVGQAVGDLGIASINMAWPLASLILAVGTGVGMGGAIHISIHKGAGEEEKARRVLGNTLLLLLLASVVISVLLLVLGKPLLELFGASGELLELSYGYIKVLALGGILQVFGTGVTPLLRNQDKTWVAMILMVINFVIDTVLSGVFVMVLGFGVEGAAFATLVGQLIALVPALIILFRTEKTVFSYLRLKKTKVMAILKSGMPALGLSFIPSVTIIILNRQAMDYGGTTAVAVFAVASYVIAVGQLLAQGVGEGSQPLISYYYGAQDKKAVKQLRRWTYYAGFAVTFLVMVGILALRGVIPQFFNVTEETAAALHQALPLFACSLPFYAFSRVTTEYFNATKKERFASLMVYGEALVILPLCAVILPLAWSLNGVWLIVLVSQFLISLTGLFLLKWKKKIQTIQV